MPKSHPVLLDRGRLTVLSLLVPAMLVALPACSGDDDRVGPPAEIEQPGDDAGGAGGSGGDGTDGGNGDGGDGGDVVDDAGPDGPDDVDPDAGETGGDGGYPPGDSVCERDVAFRSSSISFVFPTAEALGRTIEQFLSDPDDHQFVLALRGSKGANADGAISAAEIASGIYSFLGGPQKPLPTSVSLAQGRFDSEAQATAFLRFQDEAKTVTIELQDVRFTGFTQGDCQQVFAVVDATIPQAQAGLPIRAGDTTHTLGDIAGMKAQGNDNTYVSVGIRFLMMGEATSFDFSSL